jgi:RND family efflux transporter MFP subunit
MEEKSESRVLISKGHLRPYHMNKLKKILAYIKGFALRNKLWSAIGVLAVGGLITYTLWPSAPVQFEYMTVEAKTLQILVEGSGSVSTESQVDLKSTVSGKITQVYVKSGEQVKQGQAIIRIDGTEAYQNVQKATLTLQRSQLALEKLQVAKPIDEAKAQNTATTKQEDVDNAYTNARASISSAQSEMADVQVVIDDLFNCNTGYLTTCGYNQSNTQKEYIKRAESSWYKSDKLLSELSKKYRTITTLSTKEEVEGILEDAREASISVADTARYAQDAVVYFKDREDYENAEADEAYTIVTAEVSNANEVLSDMNSLYTTLVNSKRAFQEAELDVKDIAGGSNTLDLRTQELDVQEKQNALTDAQIELAKYTITAPFAGTIGSVESVQYDWLSDNTTVATLSTDKNIAEISLNEVDVTNIQVGQKAELTFDALPELTLIGTVSEIDSVGVETSNVVTFKVKIIFDEEDARIRPGMGVTGNIIKSQKENVLLVPNGSIKNENGQNYVEVRNLSTGKNDRVDVTIGESNDTNTEITSGLTLGQEIVVRQILDTATASSGLF